MFASFDPITAIKECRLSPGDRFSLSQFNLHTSDDVNSTVIVGIPELVVAQTREQKIYTMILSDFMYTEFTKVVPRNYEHMYKATASISRLMMTLPYKDSILYSSIFDRTKYNLAMTTEASLKKLEYVTTLECTFHDVGEEHNVLISNSAEIQLNRTTGQLETARVEGRDDSNCRWIHSSKVPTSPKYCMRNSKDTPNRKTLRGRS